MHLKCIGKHEWPKTPVNTGLAAVEPENIKRIAIGGMPYSITKFSVVAFRLNFFLLRDGGAHFSFILYKTNLTNFVF
jgi:hypothetical protein